MRKGRVVVTVAALALLSGCGEYFKFSGPRQARADDETQAASAATEPESTGSVRSTVGFAPFSPGREDDVGLGRQQFGAGRFVAAEHYFHRATEIYPNDPEAWIGLAACYDQLRRFELADDAYARAIALAGATPEILGSQGYSYMLRGEFERAGATLTTAQAQDPDNPYIRDNLALLRMRTRHHAAED
jgi:Flp pilus assembly protein TadD